MTKEQPRRYYSTLGLCMVGYSALFATQQSISICRDNPTPKFSGFCKFNAPNTPITIVAANAVAAYHHAEVFATIHAERTYLNVECAVSCVGIGGEKV